MCWSWCWTNDGGPSGAPRTLSPWCVAGRLVLPTQTSGPKEAMFGGIPYTGLALVEVDVGMLVEVGGEEVIDWADSLWWYCDINDTSLQHSSPTVFSNTLLQHFSTTLFSTTLFHNTPLPHFSTTLLFNTSLQHSSPTIFSNTSLQHSCSTPIRQNDVHPALLCTTKCYKILLRQNDIHPVLLLTTKYYDVHPVLLRIHVAHHNL